MKRICCVLLLLALLLTGCAQTDVSIDDSAFLPGTTAMLDAILAEDYDSCRALVTAQVGDEELHEAVTQMNQLLDSVENYTLKPVGWDNSTHNGITQSAVRYEMDTEAGKFYVEAVLVENVEGLAGFHISPIQQTTVTGSLGNMKDAGVMQWLVLVLGLAEFAFVIWMAVDCLRQKFKGRIGWLLLILFVSSLISLSISGGKISLNFNFGIYLFSTALLRDSTGALLLRLYVPVGAIVYWFQRKKLHSKESGNQEPISESDGENLTENRETEENA